MHEEVVMAGFGGQGIMMMGQLLAYAGMKEGKNVVWFPSYGPEMRGGTANCTVIVSDDEIGSPIATEPDAVIVLNQPSLERFEAMVKKGGVIVVNSSMIPITSTRDDCRVAYVPGNEIAQKLGNLRITNMVMLGAYLELTECVPMATAKECLKDVLPVRHHKLIPINSQALDVGAEHVRTGAVALPAPQTA
jgi:2-oxoglutarate ferredoxin oxidoreductase subunit gamma